MLRSRYMGRTYGGSPAGGGGVTLETFALGSNVTSNEGNSGTTNQVWTINRAGDTSRQATIDWAVTGSGANPASAADFVGGVFPSGTVTFAAGEGSKTFNVPVAGDTAVEPNETYTVTLSNARVSAVITGATGTGTITNDDSAALTFNQWVASLFAGSEIGAGVNFTDTSTLFSDVARTTPATLNGGVGGVTDLSTKNRHLSQATSVQQPTLVQVGGVNCLRFSNVANPNQTVLVSSAMAIARPMTELVVVRFTANHNAVWIGDDTSTGFPMARLYTSGANTVFQLEDGTSPTVGTPAYTAAQALNLWLVFIHEYNGPSSSIEMDGAIVATGTTGTGNTTMAAWRIGSRQFANSMAGEIAAAVRINRLLTTAEKNQGRTLAAALVGKTL